MEMLQVIARMIGLATVYIAAANMLFAAAYDIWRDPLRFVIT